MNRMNLLLHCGAYRVDEPQVLRTETPRATDTHYPIPHGDLLGQVKDHLRNIGMGIVSEEHALAKMGNRYFGMMQLQSERTDYAPVLGLRNSHDKQFPAGLVMGSGVFVCDNLCFSGEVTLARKHTKNIARDLTGLVSEAIARMVEAKAQQELRLEAYQNTPLNDRDAYAAIVQLFKAMAFPAQHIQHIVREWDEPSYEEFDDCHNVWRLMQAITTTAKERTAVFDAPKRGLRMHGVLDSLAGVVIDGEATREEY